MTNADGLPMYCPPAAYLDRITGKRFMMALSSPPTGSQESGGDDTLCDYALDSAAAAVIAGGINSGSGSAQAGSGGVVVLVVSPATDAAEVGTTEYLKTLISTEFQVQGQATPSASATREFAAGNGESFPGGGAEIVRGLGYVLTGGGLSADQAETYLEQVSRAGIVRQWITRRPSADPVDVVLSFYHSLGAGDYAGACSDIAAVARPALVQQLHKEGIGGSTCPQALAAAARRAARPSPGSPAVAYGKLTSADVSVQSQDQVATYVKVSQGAWSNQVAVVADQGAWKLFLGG